MAFPGLSQVTRGFVAAFRGTVIGAIEAATKRCKEVAESSH